MFRAAAVALAALTPFAASAQEQQQRCGPHQVIVEVLGERFGENRRVIALASNGQIVEVFANLESGTWTILVTAPGGPTCLVAEGRHFQLVDDPLPPEGVDG